MNSTITRHTSRTVAFKFLFGILKENKINSNLTRLHFSDFCKSFTLPDEDFSWETIQGVLANIKNIDALISKQSEHWRIDRMPEVDLTILRIGAYEIVHRSDIPKNVAIDEAIELAKEFGDKDSPSFVNGILDKLNKTEL